MKFQGGGMIKLFLTACCCFQLVGCATDRHDDALINPSSVVIMEDAVLSDLTDSVKFVPLETNEECLIGKIEMIKRRNDRFYINADGRLMIFDGHGRFKSLVTKIGEGPDEVLSILDYDVSEDGDIAVSTADSFVVFGEDGKKKIKHPFSSCTIRRIKDGWLAVASNPTQNGDRMVVYDNEWNIVRTLMSSSDVDEPHIGGIDLIPLSANEYLHQVRYGNELFEYNSNSGNTREYRIIASPEVMSPQEYADYRGNIMDSPKHIVRYITANRDQILLGVIEDKTIFYYLYSKKDKSVAKVNVFNLTDDISGVELMNNSLLGTLCYYDSDDEFFVSYLPGTPEMNAKFATGFSSENVEQFEDETNPILVLTKFKTPNKMK